jgi:hypothetical protein
MKITLSLIAVFFFINLVGCATYITKEEFSPKMYTERPLSILVLPPMNNSTAADAKDYYMTTVAEPLTNSGYYVYPMEIVSDILQQEGLYDTETMLEAPLQKFKEYFGADAVLYVTIEEWDTQYFITSGSVDVKVKCELKSTGSGEVIWFYDEKISVNTSGSSGSGGGWLGLLAQVVTTAIQTAATDYVPIARDVNKNIFLAMPFGKYNSKFDKDQKDKIKKREAVKK